MCTTMPSSYSRLDCDMPAFLHVPHPTSSSALSILPQEGGGAGTNQQEKQTLEQSPVLAELYQQHWCVHLHRELLMQRMQRIQK